MQEALTNVSRHAQASRAVVSVVLNGDGSTVRVAVADDGRGLPAGGTGLGPRGDGLEGGFGMSGMRERAELVGGELELRAGGCGDAGEGTTVRLMVPLAGRPADGQRLIHQAQPPRVCGQLRARGEAQLLDRAGAVGLDGALGDVQLLGDLRVGVAQCDQPHHLALAL